MNEKKIERMEKHIERLKFMVGVVRGEATNTRDAILKLYGNKGLDLKMLADVHSLSFQLVKGLTSLAARLQASGSVR